MITQLKTRMLQLEGQCIAARRVSHAIGRPGDYDLRPQWTSSGQRAESELTDLNFQYHVFLGLADTCSRTGTFSYRVAAPVQCYRRWHEILSVSSSF